MSQNRHCRTELERRRLGHALPRPYHEHGRAEHRQGVHRHVAPQARRRPGGAADERWCRAVWTPPDSKFAEATTALGLIRTARWFVAKTQDFDGWTLFFVTQFDGSLQKYFDDFVLNGKDNLLKVWGSACGCPDGPDATAADVVEFIARGQIKTLACYDFVPELGNSQIFKAAGLVREGAEVPACGGQGRRQPRGRRSTPSSRSWPSRPRPCPAPPPSIPMWRSSGSTRTSPRTCRADLVAHAIDSQGSAAPGGRSTST